MLFESNVYCVVGMLQEWKEFINILVYEDVYKLTGLDWIHTVKKCCLLQTRTIILVPTLNYRYNL